METDFSRRLQTVRISKDSKANDGSVVEERPLKGRVEDAS